jgi:hypothetical protein
MAVEGEQLAHLETMQEEVEVGCRLGVTALEI